MRHDFCLRIMRLRPLKTAFLVALILSLTVFLCGCENSAGTESTEETAEASSEAVTGTDETADETADEITPEPTEVPHVIETDVCKYSDDVRETLGDYTADFSAFSRVLSKGEKSYTFADSDAMNVCVSVMSALPVYDYIESWSVDSDSNTVSVVYNTDDVAGKLSLIEDYTQSFAAEYYNENMTALEICARVYKYTAGFSYDDSRDGILDAFSGGACSDYASARVFTYLLTQLGVDSRVISCTLADSSVHYLAAAEINDKFYAFDPVLEHSETGGSGLDYFMMSSSRTKSAGLGAAFNSGKDGYFEADFTMAVDTAKDAIFSDTAGWVLDTDSHILYISRASDNEGEYSVSFNTYSCTEITG